jgi:hypothetical protein
MSLLYLRNDLKFDYSTYQQLVGRENGLINDYFKEFTQFLEQKREKVNSSNNGELIAEVEIPEELGKAFFKAMTDIANQTVFNALFVKTNSFLEWALIESCRLSAIYLNVDFKNYKTKGRGIYKVKEFLEQELSLKIANGEWSRFTANQEIRNLIVHNNANLITDYSKKLEEQPNYSLLQANKKHFDVSETGFVFINEMEYIMESHKLAVDFIHKTSEAIIAQLESKGIK